jgi:hypothetical protein
MSGLVEALWLVNTNECGVGHISHKNACDAKRNL